MIMMAELPIYQIKGRKYYSDVRLREYRAVDDPSDRITFEQFDRGGLELETPSGDIYIPLGKESERAAQKLRARAPPTVRNLLKIQEDPDNCREFFKDIDTGEVFITAEGVLHTHIRGEPLAPVAGLDNVKIIPQACADIFKRRAQRVRGKREALRRF